MCRVRTAVVVHGAGGPVWVSVGGLLPKWADGLVDERLLERDTKPEPVPEPASESEPRKRGRGRKP